MNSSTKESDIDLLIVTDNNRLWFVRILVTFIFQILGVRKTDKHHA
jgi:predicted nucleotidyltransferase